VNVNDAVLIVTPDVVALLTGYTASWGTLTLALSEVDDAVGVVGASDGQQGVTNHHALRNHFLGAVDRQPGAGVWYRASPELNAAHASLRRTRTPLALEDFEPLLKAGLRNPGPEGATATLTFAPDGEPVITAWAVSSAGATPVPVVLLPGVDADPLETLGSAWPRSALTRAHVTLVGVGSIGGVIAHALAGYGVGSLTLVDDDRLEGRNLVRHRSGYRDLGRYKVNAVGAALTKRWPSLHVDQRRENVVTHADNMRTLFARSDVVVCAADGVASRRVVSHLSRRAGVTAVLGCVLLDGAVGEVLRLRPWPRWGCLLCNRAALVDQGALDPEPALDRDYGEGERHRPMTAVGPDLHLVGDLTAKLAVATLLERDGWADQRVDTDTALLGLRPEQFVAAPFDLAPGELRWLPAAPQRNDCATCSAG
jgi:hypothetical protein